ncbi:acyl-CoA dehydrogenase family protein [Streptomyces mirabilis]|uniref:acyl-CoA dehydrogenase family protein n=1 Tax=Streptomyces mirabilis TaxID=68239 RepID=UPI0033AA3BF1
MRFALTEEQHELRKAVRSLVDRRARTVGLRAASWSPHGYDTHLWSRLCEEIGVAALAIPEEYGGAGFTSFETHLVAEELGRSLTPSPLLGSAVIAGQAVLLAGNPVAARRLLPGLADGSATAAVAWDGAKGRPSIDTCGITATRTGSWRLTGSATLVLGHEPQVLLAIARTGASMTLFEVNHADGVTWTPTPALDPTLRFASVRFDRAEAEPLARDAEHLVAGLWQRAVTAVTALQVGGAQAALDRTVAHLKERHQFGRPLGSFQALRHRAADLLVAVESARSVSWAAAWATAHDTQDAPRRAATAKAWCSKAFTATTSEMIQLHGGIGITWEHDAHLYFKRAHATAQLFGPPRSHRRELSTTAGESAR